MTTDLLHGEVMTMDTKVLKDVLLTPFEEAAMDGDARDISFIHDAGRKVGIGTGEAERIMRVRPLRLNGSPPTPRGFDEAYALWSAIEALEHIVSLNGKRGFLRPSSEAVISAAKAVLEMEFAQADPKEEIKPF